MGSRGQTGVAVTLQASQVTGIESRGCEDNSGNQGQAGKYQALAQLVAERGCLLDLDRLLLQGELFQLMLVGFLAGA